MGPPRLVRRYVTPREIVRIRKVTQQIEDSARSTLNRDISTSTFSLRDIDRRMIAPVLRVPDTNRRIKMPRKVVKQSFVHGGTFTSQSSWVRSYATQASKAFASRKPSYKGKTAKGPGNAASSRPMKPHNPSSRVPGYPAKPSHHLNPHARIHKVAKSTNSFGLKPPQTVKVSLPRSAAPSDTPKLAEEADLSPEVCSEDIQAVLADPSESPTDAPASDSSSIVAEMSATANETLETEEHPPKGLDRDIPPHKSATVMSNSAVIAKGTLSSQDIKIEPVDDGLNKQVAILRRNLQRIPFNPGVHVMRDQRTGVWNFDPEQLHDIPSPLDFAFERTPGYLPPGQDPTLSDMARKSGSKYLGSTSTLSKAFSQIYFALSGNRALDVSPLSQAFLSERTDYSPGACLPALLKITRSDEGHIYIDNDKEYETTNILTKYGTMLEKMLTSEPDDFKRFLKSSPDSGVSEEERTDRGAYQYQKSAKLLMRSQLDCWDPRLPGTGVFDIKTRACLSIRNDRANYIAMSAYDITEDRGYSHSYEREYFDMIRATMLKYAMQVRIGMMDGIFVAYHNTKRMFGFQYIPLTEMDDRLFGSSEMGDAAFKHIVALFEILLDHITDAYPNQNLHLTIKQAPPNESCTVSVFVQPAGAGPSTSRPIQEFQLKLRSSIDGQPEYGAIGFSIDDETRKKQEWTVEYTIRKSSVDPAAQGAVRQRYNNALKDLENMIFLPTPEGKSVAEMKNHKDILTDDTDLATKWKLPDTRIKLLRTAAKASGKAYLDRVATWKENPGFSWDPIQR